MTTTFSSSIQGLAQAPTLRARRPLALTQEVVVLDSTKPTTAVNSNRNQNSDQVLERASQDLAITRLAANSNRVSLAPLPTPKVWLLLAPTEALEIHPTSTMWNILTATISRDYNQDLVQERMQELLQTANTVLRTKALPSVVTKANTSSSKYRKALDPMLDPVGTQGNMVMKR